MKMMVCAGVLSLAISGVAYAEHHEKKEMKYDAPAFSGIYMGDGFSVSMSPKGLFAAADTETGVVFVIGKYGTKDGVAWFKDIMAPPDLSEEERTCVTENKGKYAYAMDGDTITFTLSEDPCAGRAEAVNGAVLTRWSPPEEG